LERQIFKTQPFLVQKPWGGDFLAPIKKIEQENLGETWEISAIDDGECLVEQVPLSQFLAKRDIDLPKYLIKFIDTSDNLSIQVHPGDEFARLHEQTSGKTECWYILNAIEGAGIYLGFKADVSLKRFKECIEKKGDLTQFLNFYPVNQGDFFYVPAGTIHAIGKGVCLAEVQQASGVTYRVWDWNRVDSKGQSRELHVDKALKVLEFANDKNTLEYFRIKKTQEFGKNGHHVLAKHRDFSASLYCYEKDQEVIVKSQRTGVKAITCLSGEFELGNESIRPYQTVILLDRDRPFKLKVVSSGQFIFVE
jgi:mannose-6-phosphate isomerase